MGKNFHPIDTSIRVSAECSIQSSFVPLSEGFSTFSSFFLSPFLVLRNESSATNIHATRATKYCIPVTPKLADYELFS